MRKKRMKSERSAMTVDEFVNALPAGEVIPPIVPPEANMNEILAAFDRGRHSRVVYVAGGDESILGTISLGDVVRHVFFHYHEQEAHSPVCSVISMAAAEHARDFMYPDPVFARGSDHIDDVIARMLKHRLKEIPVLDERRRIVADLTMVDLLRSQELWRG